MPPKEKAETSTRWVRYVGHPLVDAREVTADQWRAAGVVTSDRHDVRWDASNGKVVNADELAFLTDAEFQRFIVADPDFKVEDSEV